MRMNRMNWILMIEIFAPGKYLKKKYVVNEKEWKVWRMHLKSTIYY